MEVQPVGKEPTVSPQDDALAQAEDMSNLKVHGTSLPATKHVHSASAPGKYADFFGRDVFQLVLRNPATAHQLSKFSKSLYCGENMQFLEETNRYNIMLRDLTETLTDIYHDFISPEATMQLNISHSAVKTMRSGIITGVESSIPTIGSVFEVARKEAEELVFMDTYPRFVRHQMTLSASNALAGDRTQFQGLGDCFCLTNPSLADNPIVYASEGFVNVTGYSRADIIPRNCRFLQGHQTDRIVVSGIKTAIQDRKESVELLLNYRKNGEPFWNLLYVAPLYDEFGKVAFFLGGQINCSSTIHSRSEVMQLLSASDDIAEHESESVSSRGQSRRSIFSSFIKPKTYVPEGVAGMEDSLVNKIGKLDLRAQMDEFYTAYSKYIVISYPDYIIRYHSAAAADIFNPRNVGGRLLVGSDVLHYINSNVTAPIRKPTRSRLKAALSAGHAVSIDIYTETKRLTAFRGDDKFVVHWTPIKDENAAVAYVVLTFGTANA